MQEIKLLKESGVRAILDPRTSLFGILVISVIMLSGKIVGIEYYLRIICWLIPFFFLLIIKKKKMAIIFFIFHALSAVVEGFLVQFTSGKLNLICIIILSLISRCLVLVFMAYCVMKTTTVSEFICAMEKMHVPQIITIPMSVMFRFFPTIIEENRAVSDAMRMRQIAGKKQSILQKIEYQIVPVMMSTVRIAEELSQASLTKGLGANIKRTHICKVGFRKRDYLLLSLLFAILREFLKKCP